MTIDFYVTKLLNTVTDPDVLEWGKYWLAGLNCDDYKTPFKLAMRALDRKANPIRVRKEANVYNVEVYIHGVLAAAYEDAMSRVTGREIKIAEIDENWRRVAEGEDWYNSSVNMVEVYLSTLKEWQ